MIIFTLNSLIIIIFKSKFDLFPVVMFIELYQIKIQLIDQNKHLINTNHTCTSNYKHMFNCLEKG